MIESKVEIRATHTDSLKRVAHGGIRENFTQELKFKLDGAVMLEVCRVKKGKGHSRAGKKYMQR